MQKMLDLSYTVCYNTITSERFFFFAKEPVVMPCALARVLFVRVFKASGCNGTGKTEGGVYFYVAV